MTLNNITHILIAVLFVNFVADHIFQIKEVREKKRDNILHLLLHVAFWVVFMQFAFAWLAIKFKPDQFFHYYSVVWILAVGHFAIDLICSFLYHHFDLLNRKTDATAVIVVENIAMNCLIVKSVLIICL